MVVLGSGNKMPVKLACWEKGGKDPIRHGNKRGYAAIL